MQKTIVDMIYAQLSVDNSCYISFDNNNDKKLNNLAFIMWKKR